MASHSLAHMRRSTSTRCARRADSARRYRSIAWPSLGEQQPCEAVGHPERSAIPVGSLGGRPLGGERDLWRPRAALLLLTVHVTLDGLDAEVGVLGGVLLGAGLDERELVEVEADELRHELELDQLSAGAHRRLSLLVRLPRDDEEVLEVADAQEAERVGDVGARLDAAQPLQRLGDDEALALPASTVAGVHQHLQGQLGRLGPRVRQQAQETVGVGAADRAVVEEVEARRARAGESGGAVLGERVGPSVWDWARE